MAKTLLHIDSSILGDASVSRTLSAAAVKAITARDPGITVVTRDLAASPPSHLSGAYLAGQSADVKHDQALQEDLDLGGATLAEFLSADIVVVGVALYNFTIPSQLKAWVDRVLVAGKTFRYGEHGPEGLCGGKRVVLAVSRGGIYSAGSPYAPHEHAESYMKTVFGFMGITAIESVVAEGVAMGPDARKEATDGALDAIAKLAA